MSDAKPYTVEEFEAAAREDDYLFGRMRATVAALESVTKERDDLKAKRHRVETGEDCCECVGEAEKERDEARAALVARHGGEPLALLKELDEARVEVERLTGVLRTESAERVRCRDGWATSRAEVERLRADLISGGWTAGKSEWREMHGEQFRRANAAEAEVERLRADATQVAYEGGKLTGELRAENERLRVDAERWLKQRDASFEREERLREEVIHRGNEMDRLQSDNERLREVMHQAVALLDDAPSLKTDEAVRGALDVLDAALAGKDGG